MIGWALSVLVIAALLAVGPLVLVAPRRASQQYGIVLDDPRSLAFVRAMGARDAVIGGLLVLLALGGTRELLGWGMGVTASIAAIDLLLLTMDRRRTTSRASGGQRVDAAVLAHASGAVALLVTAAALLAGR